MSTMRIIVAAALTVALSACASKATPQLLAAPSTAREGAKVQNDRGIRAYQEGHMNQARQYFEAAITVEPDLAEAHYNLGMTLYRLGMVGDGDHHFIQAANLAPGNKTIWDAPPLRAAAPGEKDLIPGGSDGHMHSH
ncbi:MAG: tetratricopeptide repeat protein [Nitrospira sp.]|nr:tetratricopeptide repeat protein [Nitrospira sp.]